MHKLLKCKQMVPYKENIQLLEMTLDSRLKWEEHINRVGAKAKRALNTVKVVANEKWNVDQKTLKSVQCNM